MSIDPSEPKLGEAGRMETVGEAVERLTGAGYEKDFYAVNGGLRAGDTVHPPERLVVEEYVRFEGQADPADEAVVFALRCPDTGVRGTYTVAFGANTDPLDAEMVRRLRAWIPEFDPGLRHFTRG